MKLNIPDELENLFDSFREKNKKKKIYPKIKNIILTSSDGNDFPFLHYTALGIGNLIFTYLYALYIKLNIKNSKIISFFPFRVHPLIRNLNYMYNRSSFEFNFNLKHLKRLLYFFELKNANKEIFIKKNNLFLSTDIVNQDELMFKKISSLDLDLIKKEIAPNFNLDYSIKNNNDLKLIYNKDNYISVGLHLRRGDFKINRSASSNFNTSPDIQDQINIIKKIETKIKVINIYSDQKPILTLKELNGELKNYKLNFFSEKANGTKVLQDMTKNDVIILSNSTLSTLSCILSNQLGLFNNQLFPNKLKKYFKNIKEI